MGINTHAEAESQLQYVMHLQAMTINTTLMLPPGFWHLPPGSLTGTPPAILFPSPPSEGKKQDQGYTAEMVNAVYLILGDKSKVSIKKKRSKNKQDASEIINLYEKEAIKFGKEVVQSMQLPVGADEKTIASIFKNTLTKKIEGLESKEYFDLNNTYAEFTATIPELYLKEWNETEKGKFEQFIWESAFKTAPSQKRQEDKPKKKRKRNAQDDHKNKNEDQSPPQPKKAKKRKRQNNKGDDRAQQLFPLQPSLPKGHSPLLFSTPPQQQGPVSGPVSDLFSDLFPDLFSLSPSFPSSPPQQIEIERSPNFLPTSLFPTSGSPTLTSGHALVTPPQYGLPGKTEEIPELELTPAAFDDFGFML